MRTFFTLLIVASCLCAGSVKAQLLLEENFDYDAGRALVSDAINNSDNFDGVTGWSTQNNSLSGTNCFDMTDAPLTYDGYINSGIGNALKYNGEAGQGVFKLFTKNVRNDSIVYISFLINFPAEMISGGDYFLGIKMEPAANSTNWGGRLFASVDPAYKGEEVSLGINKLSGGTTTWVNPSTGPFLPANQTHLLVIKYHVGVLNGKSAPEEAGKFDDVMSLFINPPLNGIEPAKPVLIHQDPTQNDLYRYTASGIVFGGARGLYLRTSTAGNAPAYTIDGIRVGQKWEEVVPAANAIAKTPIPGIVYTINGKIITLKSADYTAYELTGISGRQLLKGSFAVGNQIDASALDAGVYILSLKGEQPYNAKVIIR